VAQLTASCACSVLPDTTIGYDRNPLIRLVVDWLWILLYNLLYIKTTTKRTSGVQAKAFVFTVACSVTKQQYIECVLNVAELFVCFLWPPYGIGHAIIFLPCGFFFLLLSSSFFFFLLSSFSRVISAVADWMSMQSSNWTSDLFITYSYIFNVN